MDVTATNMSELKDAAKSFLDSLFEKHASRKGALVVGLKGDLGSGKTSFTKAVAELLGVEGVVTSPTFVIEKIYKLPESREGVLRLVHIDAYRIESGNEMKVLGWDDIVADKQNLIFIEWPEKISGIFPKDAPIIEFTFIDENTRRILIKNDQKTQR